MLKKLFLSLTFVSFSVCGFSATISPAPAAGYVLMYLPTDLPAPITSTGGSYVKLRLKKSSIDPTRAANMALVINELDPSVVLNAYTEASAIVRFAEHRTVAPAAVTNLNNYVDAYSGAQTTPVISGKYVFSPDGLQILFDKDYYIYFTYDLTTSPKTYSVYGRTEDMSEMYTIGKDLRFRKVPTTGLNLRATIYVDDTLITPMPTMKIKEFKASEPSLTFATSLDITSSNIVVNQKTALEATTVPANANAGIVWVVKSGAATITDGNFITITDTNPVVVDAYAVTIKGATPIMTTKTLTAITGLKDVKADLGFKLNPTMSNTGIYNLTTTNTLENNTFNVYDICGQNISTGKVEGTQLNIGTSKAGMYFVKFSNAKGSQTVQVLVK